MYKITWYIYVSLVTYPFMVKVSRNLLLPWEHMNNIIGIHIVYLARIGCNYIIPKRGGETKSHASSSCFNFPCTYMQETNSLHWEQGSHKSWYIYIRSITGLYAQPTNYTSVGVVLVLVSQLVGGHKALLSGNQ